MLVSWQSVIRQILWRQAIQRFVHQHCQLESRDSEELIKIKFKLFALNFKVGLIHFYLKALPVRQRIEFIIIIIIINEFHCVAMKFVDDDDDDDDDDDNDEYNRIINLI